MPADDIAQGERGRGLEPRQRTARYAFRPSASWSPSAMERKQPRIPQRLAGRGSWARALPPGLCVLYPLVRVSSGISTEHSAALALRGARTFVSKRVDQLRPTIYVGCCRTIFSEEGHGVPFRDPRHCGSGIHECGKVAALVFIQQNLSMVELVLAQNARQNASIALLCLKSVAHVTPPRWVR